MSRVREQERRVTATMPALSRLQTGPAGVTAAMRDPRWEPQRGDILVKPGCLDRCVAKVEGGLVFYWPGYGSAMMQATKTRSWRRWAKGATAA